MHFICLIFIICTLHAKFQKKCMPAAKLLLVKNWSKNGVHLPQPTTRTSLGNFNSYIPLLSVMTTLHYHRLYQISSLEANLSLEYMKQLCVDRSHIPTGRPPNPQN